MAKHVLFMALATILISQFAFAQAVTAPTPKATEPAKRSVPDAAVRLGALEMRMRMLQSRVPTKGASLDCDTKKYTEFQLESSTLVFLAACSKIEPYLEGFQVSVDVGNPYGLRFSNLSGTLGYGKTLDQAFERTVPVSTTASLAPGAWTSITVNVNPAKAEDLRFLELNLDVTTAGGR